MRSPMIPPAVSALLAFLISLFRSRRALHLKILALQHQVAVYQRSVPAPSAHRPSLLVMALAPLGRLAGGTGLPPTPHGHRLAAEAFSGALAALEPTQKAWPARRCQGGQRPIPS